MAFFSRQGYHDEPEQPSFFSKAFGIAKLVGGIGIAVGLGKPALKRFGKDIVELGSNLLNAPALQRTGIGRLASSRDFWNRGTSREARTVVQGAEAIRTKAFTTFYKEKRMEIAINQLRGRVKSGSEASFEDNIDFLKRLLHPIASANKPQNLKGFFTAQRLKAFNRSAAKKGIHFDFGESLADTQRAFDDIAEQTLQVEKTVDKRDVQEWAMRHGEDFFKLISAAHADERKRTMRQAARFGYKEADFITFGQARRTHADVVEQKLETLMGGPGRGGRHLDKIMEDAESALDFVFGTNQSDPDSLRLKAQELLESSSTGFAIGRKGQLQPYEFLRSVKGHAVDRILDELQIPLFPPFMNVRANLFKFGRADKEVVKDIGGLWRSELHKSGRVGDVGAMSEGLLIGERLMVFESDSAGNKAAKFVEDLRVKAYRNDSGHMSTLTQVRALDPVSQIDRAIEGIDERGLLGGVLGVITEAETSNYTIFDRIISSLSRVGGFWPLGTKIDKVGTGVGPVPQKAWATKLLGRFMRKQGVNPVAFLDFLSDNKELLSSENLGEDIYMAYRAAIDEGATSHANLVPTLKRLAMEIEKNPDRYDIPENLHAAIRAMLRDADDPNKIRTHLFSEIDGVVPVESTGELNQNFPGNFAGAVNAVNANYLRLNDIGKGEVNRVNELIGSVFGFDGAGDILYQLQEGLLNTVVQSRGASNLYKIIGGESPEAALRKIWQMAKHGNLDEVAETDLIKRLMALTGQPPGSEVSGQVYKTIGSLFHERGGDLIANERLIGNLGVALSEFDDLLEMAGGDRAINAKILQQYTDSLAEIRGLPIANRNRLINEAAEKANLHLHLQERFGPLGKTYHPQPDEINPEATGRRFFAVPSDGPSLEDFIADPWGTLKEGWNNGFRIGDFVLGAVDPNAPIGPAGLIAQSLMQMPQHLAENFGLGLSGQDRITILRSQIGFWGKRVLPMMVGYEAYKNFNANVHDLGMPGIDDFGANALANFNYYSAKIKDSLGLTGIAKNIVNQIPGLEQYFSPRSSSEYSDYLYHGDEEIRAGRGWMIGSRSNIMGGRVTGVRPNFFRRWRSHWTEASNVQISDPAHSFLPSLLHPFAPLNALLDPNWWVKAHDQDRPYVGNGWQNLPWDSPDTFLQTNSVGAYGPPAIGSFGGGFPTMMKGGGNPFDFENGTGGVAPGLLPLAGIGSGPIAGGKNSDPIRLDFHRGINPDHVRNRTSFLNSIVDPIRSQMGLYGAVFQRMPLYPTDVGGIRMQDPSVVRSFSRQMWMNERGELGALGGLGEFFRRFIKADYQSFNAWNPRRNNMPSWLPSKFRYGDPYMRTAHGELNLPGEAYERSHEWVRPLKVRGSMVGFTEEEMIAKFLNPLDRLDGPGAEDIVEFGCVDKETQILTESGWKFYNEIEPGTVILTLNHETGTTEWQTIDIVNKYNVSKKPLIYIDGSFHNSLTTKNHRWPILKLYQPYTYKGQKHNKTLSREWSTSDKLARNQQLILSAKFSDLPKTKTFSDEFVELVAWFWTEGSVNNKSCRIHQSGKVNPDNCARIEQALKSWLGPESLDMKTNRKTNPPMWKKSVKIEEEFNTYMLNVQASELILSVIDGPNKKVSCDFIKSLTEEQLHLFINVSMLADGKDGKTIGQKHLHVLEPLELAAILLGYRTNIRKSDWIYRYKGNERLATEYILSIIDCQTLAIDLSRMNISEKEYSGVVWCPTVKNSTWCAKRNGKVFFTGNSEAHKQVQRNLYRQGYLLGAEVSIYDEKNNISGTIDAIIEGMSGPEIMEIKTQGSKSWGHTPEKYIDQVTYYLHETGLQVGHIVFINRDDPTIQRKETIQYDEQRFNRILQRIGRARAAVQQMVDNGNISPFETYDLLSRIEILSRTAPDSPEFRQHVDFAMDSGGFGGFEKQRFEQSMKVAKRLRKPYNTYSMRNYVEQTTKNATVEMIANDGTIVTDLGVLRLAGVDWDQQAFAYEDPAEVLSRFGINEGKKIKVTMMPGQFNAELNADVVQPAIIGGVNRKVLESEFANRMEDSRHPLDAQILYGSNTGYALIEKLLHHDNIVTNKFMRVRTALEQFERGEVFGTDRYSWDDLPNNYIKPTIYSIMSKDPVAAGLQSGIVASLFVQSRGMKLKLGAAAAAVGVALSLGRMLNEQTTNSVWTPGKYLDQAQFDEYWDMIEYIKQTGIAEGAKRQAKRLEGVDIEALEAGEGRSQLGIGPFSMLAINATRKAKQTMFGFDAGLGSLQDALRAIPRRQRQLAEEVILQGTMKEKQRFYDLLPDPQRYVLGKFLGVEVDALPRKEKIKEFFQRHFLPDPSWEGWDPLVDTEDLRVRSGNLEKMTVEKPSRGRVAEAIEATGEISIPRINHPSIGSVLGTLHRITSGSGFEGIKIHSAVRPSDSYTVNVNLDLVQDQTESLLAEMRHQNR